ncbi:hypothetical protein K435DRAFT_863310 [Dendrothele bispora CBS 962.96]|uniref:DRBM domain-containing protein n=1 Tax=Dendrothele bispora (strain CBS 962.96) TaxID=1314807 RepID=A0A4S8LQC0_DENBC|nr:hypothetical protein K435DRAFT_863310 [Dendrothele bispora CBS 962.96]
MSADVDDSSRAELKSLSPKIESFSNGFGRKGKTLVYCCENRPRLKTMSEHFRNQLNNAAQSRGVQPVYSDSFTGTNHAPIWTSTVSMNGMQYGAGTGTSKGAARENAAREALQTLSRSRG